MRPFRIKVVNLPYKCDVSKSQIDSFRWRYFSKQRPVKYEAKVYKQLNALPALDKWIAPHKSSGPYELTQYLKQFGDTTVPIERTTWENNETDHGSSNSWDVKKFERFEAPLEFFLEWTKKKLENPGTFSPNESLYIAQCSMLDLHEQMRRDLPPPMYTSFTSDKERNKWKETARKEEADMSELNRNVMSSSIWMGLPPTETPLHKDPNHNFLVQIAGSKHVRLMTPDSGKLLLAYAKREVALARRQNGSPPGRLEMSMRGEEMMVGPERKLMSELVWGTDVAEPGQPENMDLALANKDLQEAKNAQSSEEDELPSVIIFETTLAPGAALFIPQGWYHSVRSLGNHKNGINVSANWWFKFASRLEKPRRKDVSQNHTIFKAFVG